MRERFEQFFEHFGWILRETGYAARTEGPTIADVFVYSEIADTVMIQFDFSRHTEVKEWYDKISQFEIVNEVHEQLRNDMKRLGETGKGQE